MNIMRRISKEYNEPFVDVVKGFAAMRCGKSETARTLGVSHNYFYKLLDRFKLHEYFYGMDGLRDGTFHKKSGIPNLKNQKHTDAELVAEVMKYKTSTEFRENSSVSVSTIFRRFGGFKNARSVHNG